MKRELKVLVGLACLFVIGLPVFAQPNTRSVETFVLDDFDSAGSQNYMYNGKAYSWDWDVSASRFITDGYPKTGYFEGVPNSIKQLYKGIDKEFKTYGVKTSYKRKGDNWFEVYPVADGKPFEIPFVGVVSNLDFWIWGSGYNYYLEVMVRDALGTVKVLQAGSLAFHGWKNFVISIPGWIQQSSHLRSGPENLTFVGFRIRSDAEEYVDNFVIYFDQIKYTANSMSLIYDGYELNDVDFGDSSDSEGDVK